MLNINLIRQRGNGSYLDCYDEIEASLTKKAGITVKVIQTKDNQFKNYLVKCLSLAGNFIKILHRKNSQISLSLAMGPSFGNLLPHILKFHKNFVYIYDGWPRFHGDIARIATLLNIKIIFFSSGQVTAAFNKLGSAVKAIWVPEGINVEDYHFEPFKAKTIDVLEFGRKYDQYHNKITNTLSVNNYVHLYEKNKGEIIFKSRYDFIQGLSQTKISICIPSNITHPERSEGISSMTLRYLQSMASKCLIVGILPEEMKSLFDYSPIIEIDMDNASEQILDILSNFESYIPLIEKNYSEIKKSHTWDVRIEYILQNIQNE